MGKRQRCLPRRFGERSVTLPGFLYPHPHVLKSPCFSLPTREREGGGKKGEEERGMEEGWIERIFLFSPRFGANLSARQCKIFLFVEIVPSLFGFFLLLLLSEISILVLDLLYHGVW